ncbi:MAG: glycosyltransferase [Candidatus Aphodosoma sp.]
MNILFLATWYPHRFDAMDGLFVRKHARAVARQKGNIVDVIYICAREEVTENEFTDTVTDSVRELVYYTRPTSMSGNIRNLHIVWNEWRRRRGIMPDAVHLNVISKLGWLAVYLKRRYRIPFVITEHWSGYLPENSGFKGANVISGRWIAGNASAVMPVSVRLMEAMKKHGLHNGNFFVVNNVVDDFFYEKPKAANRHPRFRFLHVSCFVDRAKNNVGMIDAINLLSKRRNDFEVIMVGNGPDWQMAKTHAENYGLTDDRFIKFVGEQPPEAVKQWMDKSDCFLFFSNYENAPVVLAESLACGLPVISSKAGNAMQLVTESRGILVDCRDTEALAAAMDKMIDNVAEYDRETIRKDTHMFSFDSVGKIYTDTYIQAINAVSKHNRP